MSKLILRWMVTFCGFVTFSYASHHEDRLMKQIFVDNKPTYNKIVRAAKDYTDTVNVQFLVRLNQVIDVDEKLQTIQTKLRLEMNWYDYRLKWNPDEYGGITDIIVPVTKVWRPDILLYNSATENFDTAFQVYCKIYHDGRVTWQPPGIFTSTCSIKIQFFPFDTQNCTLKFSSWTYDMARVNLVVSKNQSHVFNRQRVYANQQSYITNGEWDLTGALVVRNELNYPGDNATYVDATCWIIISRRPMFYLFNLVVPTILISIMGLLTFTLPVDAGEKVTLCVTILLSIFVFLLLVMEKLPATSEAIPLLGIYFASSTFLLSGSVIITVLVLNLHHRTPATSTMPTWIRVWINGYMAKMLRMKHPNTGDEEGGSDSSSGSSHETTSPLKPISEIKKPTSDIVRWRMQQLVRELRTITKKVAKADEDSGVCEEWKFAASVIDRLSFWLFGGMILIVTLVTMTGAPNPEYQLNELDPSFGPVVVSKTLL